MASLNPKLQDFWFDGDPSPSNFIKCRHRVLYGGRASSKSWEFAGMAAMIGQSATTRFLCVRRFQNKIKESVHTLIAAQINNFDFDGYQVRASDIIHENGSEYVFYGIERNVDEVKSFEGADVLWIEEAHNLTKEQWNILKPTIRKEGSEIWISFNPNLITDFVYQRFIVNPPANTRVRLINYLDNPFLSDTAKADIEDMQQESYEDYEHVYLGVPRSDDDAAIIKRSWVEAAVDAHLKLDMDLAGARTVGYDVADSGADKNAISLFDGAICTHVEEWKAPEDELSQSAKRAWSHVGNGRLIYDSIGVGAHVGSTLREAGIETGFYKFNAGGAVIDPDKEYSAGIKNGEKFENLKVQAWRDVADRLRNTYNAVNKGMTYPASELISISSEMGQIVERLKTELSTPHTKYSKRGLDMVETKDELKKRDIDSPNCFVAGTLVKTIDGDRPIELIKEGDLILTPMGYSRVIFKHENNSFDLVENRGLIGTPNHKVFTWNKGWVELRTLSSCDTIEKHGIGVLKWKLMNALFTKASRSTFSTLVDIIAQDVTAERALEMKDFYIGGFGLSIMGKFLKIATFTTLMGTGETMPLRTLSALMRKVISLCTWLKGLNVLNTERRIESSSQKLRTLPKSGINLRRGESGIQNTVRKYSPIGLIRSTSARFVGRRLNQEERIGLLPAQENAPLKEQTKGQGETKRFSYVEIAGLASSSIETLQEDMSTKGAVRPAQKKLSVKVYNLTLEEHNVYYANGVLVKNCADSFIMGACPHLAIKDKITNVNVSFNF